MPRKTKEQKDLENEKKVENKAKKKTSSASTKQKTIKVKTSATTSNKNKTTTKKKSPTKQVKKRTATTTNTKKEVSKKVDVVEYYDLPYRYNQTIVRVLAQTPNNLFIYWDISDKDRKNFEKQYGKNFFETTKPVLIIYNDTMHYQFEVEINDFANSWYLHVADSKCDYRIELGRRPIANTSENYIYITTSNEIESPNDRILLDKQQKTVFFRDVKTGNQTKKSISSISFIQNMGKFHDIYDIYNVIYPNENIEKIYDLNNPSS